MDQEAWRRALRRLGAVAIGSGALVIFALPWLLPPALRWAAAHLSRDHRVSGRGALYAAVLIAVAALAVVALGLLARRLARGALPADLRRLFGDPAGGGARGYSTLLAGWALGIGLVAFVAAAPADPWLVSEAGVVEVLQVVTLLAVAVVSLRTAARLPQRTFARAVHALVAFAAVVVVGEELSWGQSVFHWSTPARWAAANVQHETNLHNLYNANAFFGGGYLALTAGILLALAVSTALLVTHRDTGRLSFLLVRPSLSGPAAAMAASLLMARLASPWWMEVVELAGYLLLLGWALDNLRRAPARGRRLA
ncbi:MAG TPA: hypothetical protein VN811_01550 [Thermoanaerobaculia bacterium]|nr:hypothetical protein [Thermoanaerobaculia bacterium]